MGGDRQAATYAIVAMVVGLFIALDLLGRALTGGLSLGYLLGSVAMAILVIAGPLLLPRWRDSAEAAWKQWRARRSARRNADR